jgi:hypothetical protein
MPLPVPDEFHVLVVRTDFSDDVAWESVCDIIRFTNVEEYAPTLVTLEDRAYEGAGADELFRQADPELAYFFIADSQTMNDPEQSLIVVDNGTYSPHPGRTFRAVPAEVYSIDANLGISNMDFWEFADSVEADGVFRGFSASD